MGGIWYTSTKELPGVELNMTMYYKHKGNFYILVCGTTTNQTGIIQIYPKYYYS